jgi:anti-anti-sigma factor
MQQFTLAGYEPCNSILARCGSAGLQTGTAEAATLGNHRRRSQEVYCVRIEGKPWFPANGQVPSMVATLLSWGERQIVLDLAGVPKIDAAGIGELVRAYNTTAARDGALGIANPNPQVRKTLEVVGLFDRLSAGESHNQESQRTEGREACV